MNMQTVTDFLVQSQIQYFSTVGLDGRPKDHARSNFPFCRPIARHLCLPLNRGILNVE